LAKVEFTLNIAVKTLKVLKTMKYPNKQLIVSFWSSVKLL